MIQCATPICSLCIVPVYCVCKHVLCRKMYANLYILASNYAKQRKFRPEAYLAVRNVNGVLLPHPNDLLSHLQRLLHAKDSGLGSCSINPFSKAPSRIKQVFSSFI